MTVARWGWRGAVAAVLMSTAAGWAAPAQAPRLAALAGLEKGGWSLAEAGGPVRSICLDRPAQLLQLHHPGKQCSRFVVTDEDRVATVHYTCPGAGHGRTTVTVETPRAISIQTQGVADGLPFQSEYRAHRTGACQR